MRRRQSGLAAERLALVQRYCESRRLYWYRQVQHGCITPNQARRHLGLGPL